MTPPNAPTSFRFCPCCGTARTGDARFCEQCGFEIAALAAGAARPAAGRLALVAIAAAAVVAVVVAIAPRPAEPPARTAATGMPPAATAAPQAPAAPRVSREQIEDALKEVRAGVEKEPESVDARLALADALYRASGVDDSYAAESKAAYEKVRELDPERVEALVGLGNLAYDDDRHDDAIEHYLAYLEARPDDPNVRTDLGTMYLYDERPDDAIREYSAVLEEHPEFVNARFNLANAYHVKGDREKALEYYREVLDTPGIQPQLRTAVDQLMARLEGRPPPATAGGDRPPGHPPLDGSEPAVGPVTTEAGAAPPAAAGGTAAQAEVQQLLATHPIFGPKMVNLSWDTPTQGKVWVSGFPMDQMPPAMRATFLGKLGTSFGEIRARHGIDGSIVLEIVDQDTGAVMDHIEG